MKKATRNGIPYTSQTWIENGSSEKLNHRKIIAVFRSENSNPWKSRLLSFWCICTCRRFVVKCKGEIRFAKNGSRCLLFHIRKNRQQGKTRAYFQSILICRYANIFSLHRPTPFVYNKPVTPAARTGFQRSLDCFRRREGRTRSRAKFSNFPFW